MFIIERLKQLNISCDHMAVLSSIIVKRSCEFVLSLNSKIHCEYKSKMKNVLACHLSIMNKIDHCFIFVSDAFAFDKV